MQWSTQSTKQKLGQLRQELQRLLSLQSNESDPCLLLRILTDANLLESQMYAHQQRAAQNRIRLQSKEMDAWLQAESTPTSISASLKQEVQNVEQLLADMKGMPNKKLAEDLMSCTSSLQILESLSIQEEKAVNKMVNYNQVESKVQELKRKYLDAFDRPENLKYSNDIQLLHLLRPDKELVDSLQRDYDTISFRLVNRESHYAQLRENHRKIELELTKLKLSHLEDHNFRAEREKRIEVPKIFRRTLKLAAQAQSTTRVRREAKEEKNQKVESHLSNTLASEVSSAHQDRRMNFSNLSSVSTGLPCWMHLIIANILLTILIVLML